MPQKLPADVSDWTGFARYTSDMWRDMDSYYTYWVNRWKKTIDYIRGDHWNILLELDRDTIPAWKRFPVINYTNSFYAEFLKQYLQGNVRYSALPQSPDPSDLAGAEQMEQIMKYTWDLLEMSDKRIELASWVMSCGVGYLRYFWDTNTGDLIPLAIPTPDGGMIPVNPDTLEIDPTLMQPIMVDAGELGCEVIPPQMVRWGYAEEDGVMIGLLMSYDEAFNKFGEDVAKKLSYKETHDIVTTDLDIGGTAAYAGGFKPDTALVIQHYIPRNARFPNGLWWTSTENNRLLTAPNPLPAGVVPIASFRWVPVPGHRRLGMSPLFDITSSNKAYDERMARILEWQNKVIPKYVLKSGGGLSYGDINDEPGQELVVHAGGEPTVMEFRQAPNSFFQMLNVDMQDMMGVGGFAFQPSREPPPGQVQPGHKLRNPKDPKAGEQVQLAHINASAGWKEAGNIVIAYVSNFYTETRVIAIQGPDKSYQWQEFIGTDLKNVAATISVDEMSLWPWNRQELRDTMIGVLSTDFGQVLFMNEDGSIDKDRFNAVLSATGLDVSVDALDPDIIEARNEQATFKNLPPNTDPQMLPQVKFWEELATHYEEHTKVVKSKRFEAWPEHAKEAFIQHIQQTSEALNAQAEEESQAFLQQEMQLRQIRETIETKADIQKMSTEMLMDVLKPLIMELFVEAGMLTPEPEDTK